MVAIIERLDSSSEARDNLLAAMQKQMNFRY